MNVVLLFSISALALFGSKVFVKLCSNKLIGGGLVGYTLYLTVNSVVACFFFWAFNGFSLSLNKEVLIYSLIYAVIIAGICISDLFVYRMVSIAGVEILLSAFTLLGGLFAGALIFEEKIGGGHLLRVGIMLVAVLFIYLDTRRNEAPPLDTNLKSQKKTVFLKICLLSTLLLSFFGNNVITKSYAISDSVTDDNSFFFCTNAFILVGALGIFTIASLVRRKDFKKAIRLLHPKQIAFLSGNTLFSNIGSLVGMQLMAQMALSVYTPINSAVGILLSALGSFFFRERLGAFSYLAAALALMAVFI